MSASSPAPSLDREEARMAQSRAHGFWIGANLVTLCDQALETLVEKARFYPGPPPEELLERLAKASGSKDAKRSGAPFAELFDKRSLARTLSERPECPFAARLAEWSASGDDGIGWSVNAGERDPEAPNAAPIWGVLEICRSDCEFVAGPQDDLRAPESTFYGRSPAEQAETLLSARAYCEAALDEIEAALGLPAAMLRIDPVGARIRWGDDYLPSCLLPEHAHAARAMSERGVINSGIAPILPSSKPKPRV